ncbi:MAG: hypothetical protein OEW75_04160, partial [Cyclobacteriaceae bacterium]|nr:hypothetical protein [Cyclobacteriaceae bacterium]
MTLSNKSDFIYTIHQLQSFIKKEWNLTWTDFTILSILDQLQNDEFLVYSSMIVSKMNLDTRYCYRRINKLKQL